MACRVQTRRLNLNHYPVNYLAKSRLLSKGIGRKLIKSIYSMYNNAKSRVSMAGKTSYFACETGVRQGEILSPLLFSNFCPN